MTFYINPSVTNFSQLCSIDSKFNSLLILYRTLIPSTSRCEIGIQAQMPAEIRREADVIPTYMRHLSHWESGQRSPTHTAVKTPSFLFLSHL